MFAFESSFVVLQKVVANHERVARQVRTMESVPPQGTKQLSPLPRFTTSEQTVSYNKRTNGLLPQPRTSPQFLNAFNELLSRTF
jgi:hypothetical protein